MFDYTRWEIPQVFVEIRVQSLWTFKGWDAVWHRNGPGSQLKKAADETRARQCLVERRAKQNQSKSIIRGQTEASGSLNDASIKSRSSCNAMQSVKMWKKGQDPLDERHVSTPSHPNCSPPPIRYRLGDLDFPPRGSLVPVYRVVDVLPDSICPGIGCNSMGLLLVYRV
jgi:hypothetical protein